MKCDEGDPSVYLKNRQAVLRWCLLLCSVLLVSALVPISQAVADDQVDGIADGDDVPDRVDADVVAEANNDEHFDIEDVSEYDYIGWTLRVGLVGGFPDGRKKSVDFDPGIGYAIAVGYRQNAYMAGEVGISFIYDADTNDFDEIVDGANKTKALRQFEVTVSAKGYPLGYFDVEEVPDWIQPYVITGLGFGESQFNSTKENRIVIRFGTGVDFVLTDRFGAYVDGGYSLLRSSVQPNKGSILNGQGQISAGGTVRF
ncbi:MAG: hypothetical protein ACI8W3_001557 [Myxococcota bacterium]|jgi:hypothetical protein